MTRFIALIVLALLTPCASASTGQHDEHETAAIAAATDAATHHQHADAASSGSAPDLLSTLHPLLEADAAAQRLAHAISIPTVSPAEGAIDSTAFRRLHRWLEQSFPLVHRSLEREVVGGLSLLYRWNGTDPTPLPILLMAHQDVVPVDPRSEKDWSYPPFSATVADGFIWGRGTIDNKQGVLGILEAVEMLLATGFAPGRTVYLAFGHDEEIGGTRGAASIASLLRDREVRFEMVLDEGGFIVKDFLANARGSIAGIGVAEKGSVSVELFVNTEGGHSAVPGSESAIDIITRASVRLQRKPFPRRLQGVPLKTLKSLSRTLPPTQRFALSHLWLFKPIVVKKLSASPETSWMLQTTTAVTMIDGGTKPNVVASSASIVVNFRTMPGETLESVIKHVSGAIRDPRVAIRPVGNHREAATPSRTDSPAYGMLARTVTEIAPEASVTVVPYLVPGGTDARYFTDLSESVYRFAAIHLSKAELKRFHANDERLSVHEYARAIKFYYRLIDNMCAPVIDAPQAHASSRF